MPEPAASRVAADVVASSRRYRWLAPALVQRIAATETPKARNAADAVKRTKRRLHQIFGAYTDALDPRLALAALAAANKQGDETLREACAVLMGRHASTRERLPVIDQFYRGIFEITGTPRAVMDVACGLGPLALPWMNLPSTSAYLAYEIDQRLVDIVEGFLQLKGVPHRVALQDVVADPPEAPVDVALLLKSTPCLDQQANNAARLIVESLNARWLAISYPTQSLGGAGKGMLGHYRDQFNETLAAVATSVTELLFPGEVVFVMECAGVTQARNYLG